jgi:hypothetical protein
MMRRKGYDENLKLKGGGGSVRNEIETLARKLYVAI